MIHNSELVKEVILKLFEIESQGIITDSIEQECSETIPMHDSLTPESFDRIRLSVIKLVIDKNKKIFNLTTEQNNDWKERLKAAIQLAHIDWRDLFMATDFQNDINAHYKWAKNIVNK